MENKMFAKPMYKCAICDKIFEDVVSRATCELECAKRVEEEAKKAANEKKKAEQMARLAEIDEAYAKADELMEKYIEDYSVGEYIDLPDLLTLILGM